MMAGLFAGGGETGRLMAGLDWAGTPLGAVDQWPQSLRSAVRIVLSSRYPMLLLWGPEYTQLYNDAYSALIGDQHPAALGGDVRVTLEAGWAVLEPLIAEAMATGVASWVPALQLMLERAGYREEAYFSVSHAPARDDDGRTVGVLTVCSEVTDQVVGERRLRLLRELSVRAGGEAIGAGQTCERLAAAIAEHPLDVPFAGIYLRDGDRLRRVASCGTSELPDELPEDAEPGTYGVTGGPWDLPVRTAVTIPLHPAGQGRPLGVLVAGASPSRALDDGYRSFFHLLAQQVSLAVRNAYAYEEERRRAEQLAELDRVKTAFFTNVSHAFRTPLTLMLGPLTEALADTAEPLGELQHERVDTARRNATRLLTLVNNLMTFSSLEAGRAGNTPRRIDLAGLTADLAGVFRSAVERASLRLVVDSPPLPRPTAVDPVNWETIVTNLVSNALKFTFVGEIRVTLDSDDQGVRLRVADSGIGINADELPHLFDRFHRVQGAQARSHEGSGIGLALVRELTRLLGGEVTVASAPGSGTTFTVTLPWKTVTPQDETPAMGTPTAHAYALAEEAQGWLAVPDPVPVPVPASDHDVRILVADDNSDMRAYLQRLLTAENWQVETVGDGQAALEAIRRRPPDLLITDAMMPRMDGFALVRTLRRHDVTRTLPIVMLSARAGGEAGVEGLDAGADDYVVKPFTPAELIARVRSNLQRDRGASARPRGGSAGTTAVIASGRALEEAVHATTEQARALLDGLQAFTELSGGPDRRALMFSTPLPDGKATAADSVRTPVKGRDGSEIGSVTVLLGAPAPAHAQALLAPVAAMLAALAESRWELDHERQIAITLQQSVLPETLPAVPGWELSARYQPASGNLGGDWYDVITLPGDDLLLVIGDVAGHGLGAAVTAAQLRNAVRAYAVEDGGPQRILSRIVSMLGRLSTPYFATMLLARLTPATGEVTWCTAGHPAPLQWTPGQAPVWLRGVVGPPLGLSAAAYTSNGLVLPPGGYLLFFTDGLIETRDEPLDTGVSHVLARCSPGAGLGVPAADLLTTALAAAVQPAADDIAALALRRDPGENPATVLPAIADLEVSWRYPLVPTASSMMRADLRATLTGMIDADLLGDLQLAATEAVNNAVEHAQQPTRPEIDVRLRIAHGTIRVSVQDYGSWRGRPAPLDRGRGALLMNAYGEVRVTSSSTGTLVSIERRLTS
ncbi:hypothetical protein GCM10010435_96310 [Winogradskya consettensis]|uniref:histidine kinase n=1 Tax=Winogradskya consettensis TaxID=113560 RepID=A0A919VXG1_9ACTN|nr:SpoIIE family protein phosphatase [Actinoplanes consettensis]GIM79332.1 hypothetical protein Aco04nite_64940 [Actinoplanes consettensis]